MEKHSITWLSKLRLIEQNVTPNISKKKRILKTLHSEITPNLTSKEDFHDSWIIPRAFVVLIEKIQRGKYCPKFQVLKIWVVVDSMNLT